MSLRFPEIILDFGKIRKLGVADFAARVSVERSTMLIHYRNEISA